MFLLCGCATLAVDPSALTGELSRSIHLVSQGWHTGIVIRRADIPEDLWPEAEGFPGAEYLVVGWGDRDYYQASGPAPWLAVKAALAPTQSVLHVVGFQGPVTQQFPGRQVVELDVSLEGLRGIVQYIHDAHARDGTQTTDAHALSQHRNGHFFPGQAKFHLLNTCNVWASRALRAAGLPVRSSIRTKRLMAQARRLGRVVQATPNE